MHEQLEQMLKDLREVLKKSARLRRYLKRIVHNTTDLDRFHL